MSTKLSKILLPVSQQGTAEACRQAAFGLARDFAARLEVLHLCPAAWQRLPYASEISPFYSEEVLDICRGQVSAEQSEVKAWFEQALSAHPGASADFRCIEGFPATTMAAAPALPISASFRALPRGKMNFGRRCATPPCSNQAGPCS